MMTTEIGQSKGNVLKGRRCGKEDEGKEFCAKDSTLILCILVRFISAWIYFNSEHCNTLGLPGVHLLM